MLLFIFLLIAILLFTFLILRFYPAFGKKPSLERVQSSPQHSKGSFNNSIPTSMDTSFFTSLTMIRDLMKRNSNRKPDRDIPMVRFPSFDHPHSITKISWFGHSASMVEIGGKRLLLDPMFGRAPSPFPWIGGKRYSTELPFEIDKLPSIDAVIFSHDHYDHLDYGTIRKLRGKVKQFFVPIGVGSHLERWGVHSGHIKELDWWDEVEWDGLTLACTPARHFSGRSLHDRNATLWCSWCIIGNSSRIFFSGDSGYGPHFKEIGLIYGPFDLCLMECGQYDPRWAPIHMSPEETVQAHMDVKGKRLLPIHWGAFTLSFHEWTDPIKRVTECGAEQGVHVVTPRIGETFPVEGDYYPSSKWWE
ncbi:MBL fold metallo-hydrolase [Rossellomorea aquimaris]|uniref:MBL fold metallo-hydrolase n=1 Tax=Rossellomorea aquimaris TaxID=189382 RepID=UPI0005CA1570|nr:MBL fold metallo-hydrolase [Rossellomorea aquimaris]